MPKPLAERGFDPRTSGLWAQHASTAPLCYLRSREVLPSYIKRSRHCLCKAGVDLKWQDSFNSFAPRLKNIASTKKECFIYLHLSSVNLFTFLVVLDLLSFQYFTLLLLLCSSNFNRGKKNISCW